MRTTKELVIKAASEIADKDGLSGVSLKAVAESLQIRTPSLYNHIAGLEQLLRETAHVGMFEMNRRMAQAAIGVSGDAAIRAVAVSYLGFMIEHPGVYETIQWASWHANEQTELILREYYSLLEKLVASCGLNTVDLSPAVRLLSGFLHGYSTQQLGNALADSAAALADIADAVNTVLLGVRQKYC